MVPEAMKAVAAPSIRGLDGPHRVAEPKLDGVRLLAHVCDEQVVFHTRNGEQHSMDKLPVIAAELMRDCPDDTWIDGELWSTFGFGSVSGMLALASPTAAARKAEAIGATFMAFDLLMLGGEDLRRETLAYRTERLNELAVEAEWGSHVTLVPQYPVSEAVYDAFLKHGFEGAVVKETTAMYGGRGWWKIKPTLSDDYVVMGFEEGKNGWAGGPGKIVFGLYLAGELVEVGKCRIKDDRMRRQATDDPDSLIGRVLEVRFQERTADGRLRFPRFLRWRDDKPASECRYEEVE